MSLSMVPGLAYVSAAVAAVWCWRWGGSWKTGGARKDWTLVAALLASQTYFLILSLFMGGIGDARLGWALALASSLPLLLLGMLLAWVKTITPMYDRFFAVLGIELVGSAIALGRFVDAGKILAVLAAMRTLKWLCRDDRRFRFVEMAYVVMVPPVGGWYMQSTPQLSRLHLGARLLETPDLLVGAALLALTALLLLAMFEKVEDVREHRLADLSVASLFLAAVYLGAGGGGHTQWVAGWLLLSLTQAGLWALKTSWPRWSDAEADEG